MGYRVHVVKKHEDYAPAEAFNYKNQEFADLLDALGCDVYTSDNYETFECRKELYEDAIKIVKAYIEKGTTYLPEKELGISHESYLNFDAEYADEELGKCEDTFGYDVMKLLEIMKMFLDNCDKNWDYIKFVCW